MRSIARIALGLCALAMVDCVETPSEAITPADPPRRATRPVWIDKPAAPITISVRDLDVHEFARRLTSMTGVPIVVFPAASGNLAIDVKRMPWDAALAAAIAPLGLRYDLVAEKIVIRPDQRSGVIQAEPPPGYYRRDQAVPVVYNVIVRFDLHKKTK